jgi:pilus assembly protein CpaB
VSLRTVFVVLLAIAFGIAAAAGINLLRNQTPAVNPADTVTVVVAVKDIPRGYWITKELLATKEYPKALVPAGAIPSREEAVERTAYVPIAKDEVLLDSKLASRYSGRGLAPLIPEGMRACAITTNLSSAVAGFILPGNRVDVLLSMADSGNNAATGGASTTTLLQNVEILAVDQLMDTPADNKVNPNLRSVTLLVTPDQAAKLQLGQTKGQLHLTLRNPGDTKDAYPTPATLGGIQFHQEKPSWLREAFAKWAAGRPKEEPKKEEPKQAPPMRMIQTFRGTSEGFVIVQGEDRGGAHR